MNAFVEKFRAIWPHRLNDYLLVTLITVLIWVYAEGRNVRTYQPNDRVPVTIQLATDDLVVTSQSVSTLGLEFSAATAEIDKLRPLLGKRGILLRPAITEPGTKVLQLDDEMRSASPLDEVSANVNWSDPTTIEVTVDRLARPEVTVGYSPGDVKLVEGSLSIEPRRVRLIAPQQLLADLGIDETFVLEAEPLIPVRSVTPGEQKVIDARVKLPAALANNPHVSLERSDVKLTLTVDKAEETLVLANVPVWIAAPPGSLAEYTVTLDEDARVLADVKVTGPKDVIDQVRDGRTKIFALLNLDSTQLASAATAQTNSKIVTINVPDSLIVEGPVRTVGFTVTRKPAAVTP